MSTTFDWLPHPVDAFKIFADNFCELAKTHAAAWNLNDSKVSELNGMQLNFNTFYEISKVKQSRTTQDVVNTGNARKPYEKAIREMGQFEMKHNINMTDAERTACGVPNDDKTHTQSPVADIAPVIEFEHSGRLGGKITSLQPGITRSRAKPKGQMGVLVKIGFYQQGAAAPLEEQCTQTEMLSHSPQQVVFAEEKFGMMFVGYARYINTRQEAGRVSTMFTGIVS